MLPARSAVLVLMLLLVAPNLMARHIKGGYLKYENVGSAANTATYRITVYIFKNCDENGPMPGALTVYNAQTYTVVQSIGNTAPLYTLQSTPRKSTFDPCMGNPPVICYQVYSYSTVITLPNNADGYIVAVQDANREAGIVNIANSTGTGITMSAIIPGVITGVDYHINSSPDFLFTDTAIICFGNPFQYQFIANDLDHDSLSYALNDGINGTQAATPPPFTPLKYISGFSGTQPLGTEVSFDQQTGMVSGVAPSAVGTYVIAVYVTEWRQGVAFNTTKKELVITVNDCSLQAASLEKEYLNCDSLGFQFRNKSFNSSINSYTWFFGDGTTSNLEIASHTYRDTGVYKLQLKVGNAAGCRDSATALVKVYPGFSPSYTFTGSCYKSPFQFQDRTTTRYGVVNQWRWEFGDPLYVNDTSLLPSPSYTYDTTGAYVVVFSVGTSKGCSKVFTDTILATGSPYYVLPFKDTLICSIDSLPLRINSTAPTVYWTPSLSMLNPTAREPLVFPKDTTTYMVHVEENGCADSALVRVNVLDFITVDFPDSYEICANDSIQLVPRTEALSFLWTERSSGQTLSNDQIKSPWAAPATTTTYDLTANLGHCQDKASVTVFAAPYPVVNAGADTIICFDTKADLKGVTNADQFYWSAYASIDDPLQLSQPITPSASSWYILNGKDSSYCRKTVRDSVLVTVLPKIVLDAGRDTAVVLGQPLQLHSSGSAGLQYQWKPATGLDNALVSDPLGRYAFTDPDSIVYTVRATSSIGCSATDQVKVMIYKIPPDILVPTAFTPNADGLNDIIKPIPIGIRQFNYFKLYDEWGVLVYQTGKEGEGWDGNIKGTQQRAQNYVYQAEGIDYLGNRIYKRGITTLIR